MKRILFILAIFALTVGAFAQRGASNSITADTLNGAETVNFTLAETFTNEHTLCVQALCTQVGGTSDGTLALYGYSIA